MTEMSISHIMNAEAEKIQAFVQYAEQSLNIKTKDYIQFNYSVSSLVEEVTMGQWLSLKKLDRISRLIDEHCDDRGDHRDGEYGDHEEYCEE